MSFEGWSDMLGSTKTIDSTRDGDFGLVSQLESSEPTYSSALEEDVSASELSSVSNKEFVSYLEAPESGILTNCLGKSDASTPILYNGETSEKSISLAPLTASKIKTASASSGLASHCQLTSRVNQSNSDENSPVKQLPLPQSLESVNQGVSVNVDKVNSNSGIKNNGLVASTGSHGVSGLNGSSKLLSPGSGNVIGGAGSYTYVGTVIKKGKEVAQKVVLTPVRSKDGAITRFILPKTRGSGLSPSFVPPKSFLIQSASAMPRGVPPSAPVRPLPPPSAPVKHLSDTLPQATKTFTSSPDIATIAAILPAASVPNDADGNKQLANGMKVGGMDNMVAVSRHLKHVPLLQKSQPMKHKHLILHRPSDQDNCVSLNNANACQQILSTEAVPEAQNERESSSATVNPCSKLNDVDMSETKQPVVDSEVGQSLSSKQTIISTLHIPDQPVTGPQFLFPFLQMPCEGNPNSGNPNKLADSNPSPGKLPSTTTAHQGLSQPSAATKTAVPNKKEDGYILSQQVVHLTSGQQAIVQIVSTSVQGQQIMSGQASPCITIGPAISQPAIASAGSGNKINSGNILLQATANELPDNNNVNIKLKPVSLNQALRLQDSSDSASKNNTSITDNPPKGELDVMETSESSSLTSSNDNQPTVKKNPLGEIPSPLVCDQIALSIDVSTASVSPSSPSNSLGSTLKSVAVQSEQKPHVTERLQSSQDKSLSTPVEPQSLNCTTDTSEIVMKQPFLLPSAYQSKPNPEEDTATSSSVNNLSLTSVIPKVTKSVNNIKSIILTTKAPTQAQVKQSAQATSQNQVLSVGGRVSEERRKRKHLPVTREGKKTIAVKRLEPLPGAVDVDPVQIIEWNRQTNVGTMPGSNIKFVMNTFGGLQVVEINNSIEPPKIEINEDKDEICKCVQCQCYGLVTEFVDKKYCSTFCRDEYLTRKALARKRELILDSSGGGHLLTATKRKLLEKALVVQSNQSGSHQSNNSDEVEITAVINTRNEPVIDLVDSNGPTSCSSPNNEIAVSLPPCPPLIPVSSGNSTPSAQSGIPSQPPPPLTPICTTIQTSSSLLSQNTSASAFTESDSLISTPLPNNSRSSSPLIKVEPSDESEDVVIPQPNQKPQLISIFDWHKYLEETGSTAAWIRLFADPFPLSPNLFQIGHRLEAIDPYNQSLICVASVADISGYRLRIHFDGYDEKFDVWYNADSFDIMPCGWAKSNGLELSVPPFCDPYKFSWLKYLQVINCQPAPKSAFTAYPLNGINLFEVGMKVEAVDKKNRNLVCVASVAAVVNSRIRIHFDSWDDHYDYWCDSSSPLIKPVGWCKANKMLVTPPHRSARPFSWQRYLNWFNAKAAPECAFMTRPPVHWKKNTKVEAVDPRVPSIVRVATIRQVLPYQVRVTFDGFPQHFGWWYDDDSPDLHPVGWCQRTGTPLAPPPSQSDIKMSTCSTGGCIGHGNSSNRSLLSHNSVLDCPFTPGRINNSASPLRKVVGKESEKEKLSKSCGEPSKSITKLKDVNEQCVKKDLSATVMEEDDNNSTKTTSNDVESSVPDANGALDPMEVTLPSSESEESRDDANAINTSTVNNAEQESIKAEATVNSRCSSRNSDTSESWCSDNTITGSSDVLSWDSARITRLVETAVGSVTSEWNQHKLDGEAFLMLVEADIVNILNFSSTDATLIMNLVQSCQNKLVST